MTMGRIVSETPALLTPICGESRERTLVPLSGGGFFLFPIPVGES